VSPLGGGWSDFVTDRGGIHGRGRWESCASFSLAKATWIGAPSQAVGPRPADSALDAQPCATRWSELSPPQRRPTSEFRASPRVRTMSAIAPSRQRTTHAPQHFHLCQSLRWRILEHDQIQTCTLCLSLEMDPDRGWTSPASDARQSLFGGALISTQQLT
jgi:hypothetical protein